MKLANIVAATGIALVALTAADRPTSAANPGLKILGALAQREVQAALKRYTAAWNTDRMKVESRAITSMSYFKVWKAFEGKATIITSLDPEARPQGVLYRAQQSDVFFAGPKVTPANVVRMIFAPGTVRVKVSPDPMLDRWDVGL